MVSGHNGVYKPANHPVSVDGQSCWNGHHRWSDNRAQTWWLSRSSKDKRWLDHNHRFDETTLPKEPQIAQWWLYTLVVTMNLEQWLGMVTWWSQTWPCRMVIHRRRNSQLVTAQGSMVTRMLHHVNLWPIILNLLPFLPYTRVPCGVTWLLG